MPCRVRAAHGPHAARRSAGRFVGTEPEPRPGLRGGHIPGAKSLPFVSLLKDGRYKPAAELQAAFDAAGLDLEKPIVGSCGTGLTACVLALAAYQLTGKLVRGVPWPVCVTSVCMQGGRAASSATQGRAAALALALG